MPDLKHLRHAEVAVQVATCVLGFEADEKAIENFALDPMHVPVERLQAILTALPLSEKLAENIANRTTALGAVDRGRGRIVVRVWMKP